MNNTESHDVLADRQAIVDVTTRVAVLADRRRWAQLRDCFTATVDVDYTALAGGEPETLPAEELIQRWQDLLETFHATQHLLANHLVKVDGDAAACDVDVRATHFQPTAGAGTVWQVGGYYEYRLSRTDGGWRVRSMRFVPTWSWGNPALSPTGEQVAG